MRPADSVCAKPLGASGKPHQPPPPKKPRLEVPRVPPPHAQTDAVAHC
jgi:hypothetical protein